MVATPGLKRLLAQYQDQGPGRYPLQVWIKSTFLYRLGNRVSLPYGKAPKALA